MQSQPLLVSDILRFAAAAHPAREIVSRQIDEPIVTSNYAQLARRAGRLAGALTTMGVRPGERVATLAWNTIRHLELFYAVPGLGAVLNTVNPRLFEDQIAYILEHAEVARLFVESDLVPLVERLAPSVQGLRDVVVLCAADRLPANTLGAISYEALLDGREDCGRMAGAERKRRCVPLLHVWHHRRSQRRALQPSRGRAPRPRRRP